MIMKLAKIIHELLFMATYAGFIELCYLIGIPNSSISSLISHVSYLTSHNNIPVLRAAICR